MFKREVYCAALVAGVCAAGCASDSGGSSDFSTVDTSNPNDMPVAANTDGSIRSYNTTANVDVSNMATKSYTVASGDSLWKIARDHNTSIAVIKALNNLETNTLQVGQTLKIPSNQ